MKFFQRFWAFLFLFLWSTILLGDYRSLEELEEVRLHDRSSYTAFFPGSFDPPHRSHFLAVSELIEKYHFDKVYVVVNTLGPKNFLSSVDERLEMVKAVLGKYGSKVTFIKEPMEGKEFLKDELIRQTGTKLFGVTGGDGWDLLPQTVKDDLSKSWVIMPRPEMNFEDNYPMRDNLFVMKRSDYGQGISSSELRQLLAQGADLSGHIPNETLKVMQEFNLYGVGRAGGEKKLQEEFQRDLQLFKRLTRSASIEYPEMKPGQSSKAWRENFMRTYIGAMKFSASEAEAFWKSYLFFVDVDNSCLSVVRKLLLSE